MMKDEAEAKRLWMWLKGRELWIMKTRQKKIE